MTLLAFHGTECPHCRNMDSIIARLNKEGLKIKKLEVWHNDKNAELMGRYNFGKCGGVPFFYNTVTEKFICGETTYASLKKWGKAKKGKT